MVYTEDWRSGARSLSRHPRQLYDRGYQFGNPDRAVLRFGPWNSVALAGGRSLGANELYMLKDGRLIDGTIYPLWGQQSSISLPITNLWPFGMQEIPRRIDLQSYIFSYHATNNDLQITTFNGSSYSTYDTNTVISNFSSTAKAAFWDDSIYVVQPGISGVHRYTIVGVWSAVASSPVDGQYIFLFDNNMMVLRRGNVGGVTAWELVWAVDSDPTDWTGVGSGSAPLYRMGAVKGVAVLSDRVIVIGEYNARMIIPVSGGSSPFAIRQVNAINGMYHKDAIVAVGDVIYYVGRDRYLYRFEGNTAQPVGQSRGLFTEVKLRYLRRLGLIAVINKPAGIGSFTDFFDPDTNQWVGRHDTWEYNDYVDQLTGYADADMGSVVMSRAVADSYVKRDLDPSTFDVPEITLGDVSLDGEEWVIEYIDVWRTSDTAPLPPALDLRLTTRNNSDYTINFAVGSVNNITEINRAVRYHVNKVATDFNILLKHDIGRAAGSAWSLSAGIERIEVTISRESLKQYR